MSSAQTGTTRLRPLPEGSRYQLILRIASGGMATVYLGRLKASAGFWKLRAIKRAHAHLVEDDELRNLMIAEARLCARIEHPNVVAMQDVEELQGELLLIMDYVEGTSLVELLRHYVEQRRMMPPEAAVRLVLDAAAGLEAAHALTDDDGQPLGLVHRDVSPQNILVGRDGVAKVADFGIAKCMQAKGVEMTRTGGLKGKVGYMSPEYVRGTGLDARADVFALGVVLWELLCGRRLFRGANELVTLQQVASMPAPRVSSLVGTLGQHIEAVVSRALDKKPERRFQSMASFARALHGAAIADKVLGDHVETQRLMGQLFGARLDRRRELIRQAVAELDRGSPPERPASERISTLPAAPAAAHGVPAAARGGPAAYGDSSAVQGGGRERLGTPAGAQPAPVPPPPPDPFVDGTPESQDAEPLTVRGTDAEQPTRRDAGPSPSSEPETHGSSETPALGVAAARGFPREPPSAPYAAHPAEPPSHPAAVAVPQAALASAGPAPRISPSEPPPRQPTRGSEPPVPPAPPPLTLSEPAPPPLTSEPSGRVSEPPPSSGARHSSTTRGVSRPPASDAAGQDFTRWMVISALLGVVAAGITWFALSSQPGPGDTTAHSAGAPPTQPPSSAAGTRRAAGRSAATSPASALPSASASASASASQPPRRR